MLRSQILLRFVPSLLSQMTREGIRISPSGHRWQFLAKDGPWVAVPATTLPLDCVRRAIGRAVVTGAVAYDQDVAELEKWINTEAYGYQIMAAIRSVLNYAERLRQAQS